jgi:hypothetical protein
LPPAGYRERSAEIPRIVSRKSGGAAGWGSTPPIRPLAVPARCITLPLPPSAASDPPMTVPLYAEMALARDVPGANRKGSACCTLRAQNPSLSPRGGPPWGQAVNRDRGRMRNRISRRRTAVHGLTGCPRSLAGLAELRSKPTGGSSRSAAAAAATSITDPPGNPSLAGRRAGAVRRVVGRGRGDAPQLHRTAERRHRAAGRGAQLRKAASRGRRRACPP